MISGIRDIDIAPRIRSKSSWQVETRGRRDGPRFPEAASSTLGKCVDAPVRYLPKAIMACRNYRNQLALLTADSAL